MKESTLWLAISLVTSITALCATLAVWLLHTAEISPFVTGACVTGIAVLGLAALHTVFEEAEVQS